MSRSLSQHLTRNCIDEIAIMITDAARATTHVDMKQTCALTLGSIILLATSLTVACSGEEHAREAHSSSDGGNPGTCEALYGDACDSPCDTDAACAGGLHCAAGRCTAECGREQGCENGTCSPQGRCVSIMIDPSPSGGGPGMTCVYADVHVERQPPNVVLLIDQSGSMTSALGSTDRWNAVRDILIGPATAPKAPGLVGTFQNEVRFGVQLYSARKAGNSNGCPALAGVPLALGGYDALATFYRREEPESGTPTGESYELVRDALLADPEPGRKVIVLATDGEPDLCGQGSTSDAARERTVTAVKAAYQESITTFVISVGDEVGADHLQQVANVGSGKPRDETTAPARYFVADDVAALEQAFRDIIDEVRSCTFELDGQVAPSDANQGVVTLDGETLVLDAGERGWRLASPTTIELLGTACTDVLEGAPVLGVRFPCGVVVK